MTNRYPCPCCGYLTYEEEPSGNFDICPVCFWEDDPFQATDPTTAQGANKVSLLQAQINYKEFGACEHEMRRHVRPPKEGEKP
ncbi:CPCC family cysteine-rich protein [Terasakiella pusilla]|uniref:CPCC family cysteine-rich protein n=1 Tax=Terasakiella pusilla TaxID=64973 RepID=UPI003AA992B3